MSTQCKNATITPQGSFSSRISESDKSRTMILRSALTTISLEEFSFKKEETAMDPTKFDQFTKVLANSTSRRRALKGFVVATVGGLFSLGTLQKISTVAAEGNDSATIANHNSNVATSGSTGATMGGNASAQTSPITETLSQSGPPSGGPITGVTGISCLPVGDPCELTNPGVCCTGLCSRFTSVCCLPSGSRLPSGCNSNTVGTCCSGICNIASGMCL